MKLIATKNQTYKTRHLVAGDPFEASDRVGHLLIAIRKAKPASETKAPPARTYAEPQQESGPPPKVVPYTAAEEEVINLRRAARRLGIAVDKRWGAQRLRDIIAQAQSPT